MNEPHPPIPAIDIRPDHWAIVRDILQRHVPQYAVWAFGSRAKWTAKEFSDLDLAIITDKPLPLSISAALADDFSESDLPWKVDIVDWAATSEAFRKIIERDKVVVQEQQLSLGTVVSKWPIVRLGDYVDASLGKMLDAQKNKGTPKPYLGNSNVRWGRFDLSHLALMKFEDNESERYEIRNGDLIVCEGGEPGRCAIWREEIPGMMIQKALHRVRPKKGLDNYYLFYWLTFECHAGRLEPFFTGTTIKHLTGRALSALELPLPPIKEQRAMARILRSLDDKIELNRRMNETLEAMARALFKSRFVDFDGVPAKDLQESGRGFIPKGWTVSTLGSICEEYGGFVQTGPFGSQLHASDYTAEGIPVVMPQDMSNRRVQTEKIAKTSEYNAMRLARHRMQLGDIVFSRRGDIGRHALISDIESGWLCGTGCLLVRPGNIEISTYLSCALAYKDSAEWLIRHAIGATMPNLNTEILSALPIVRPSEDTVQTFDNMIRPIHELVTKNRAKSQTLTQLRDILLPKLISGELRLKDAERIAETA